MTQNKIATISMILLGTIMLLTPAKAQQKTDSVILNVGKSKIIFLINDPADLKRMQAYDLNKILGQLGVKLTGDSTLLHPDGTTVKDTTVVASNDYTHPKQYREEDRHKHKNGYQSKEEHSKKPRIGTRHAINFDIGVNNYLTPDGDFPDQSSALYTVKPLGSWYVGINSIYNTRIVGPCYIEWGGGVSWYNFKFDNVATRLVDMPDRLDFAEVTDPNVTFKKSKLTAFYVQASVVPMLDFSKPSRHLGKIWNGHGNNRGFRLGFGGYVGYKLDSYAKIVTDDNGKKEKERNHDAYHLENFRYGARVQIGFRDTDLFFNYDLNELFIEGQGPKLNAFSFGLTL